MEKRPDVELKATIAVALSIALVSLVLNAYLLGEIGNLENNVDDLGDDLGYVGGRVGDHDSRISIMENQIDVLESRDWALLGRIVSMWTTPTPEGYRLDIAAGGTEELNSYRVVLIKNDQVCFSKILNIGPMGQCPANAYLNFTDLTSDNKLTDGDFFTLENLESGVYQVRLMWKGTLVAVEVINEH